MACAIAQLTMMLEEAIFACAGDFAHVGMSTLYVSLGMDCTTVKAIISDSQFMPSQILPRAP